MADQDEDRFAAGMRYVTVGVLGVAVSFGVGALLLRLPGVSRIV